MVICGVLCSGQLQKLVYMRHQPNGNPCYGILQTITYKLQKILRPVTDIFREVPCTYKFNSTGRHDSVQSSQRRGIISSKMECHCSGVL